MKRAPCCALLALTATVCLTVGAIASAQQPAAAQQPATAPVPSIEELKRQLEAKRQEAKRQLEAKQQPKAKPQPESIPQPAAKPPPEAKPPPDAEPQVASKPQPELKPPLEPKPQSQAKQQLKAKPLPEAAPELPPPEAAPQPESVPQLNARLQTKPKQPPVKPTPGEPESGASPLMASAEKPVPSTDVTKGVPLAKNISPVRLEPNSAAAADSCPYPAAARDRGDTGTVILLIYVAPDGRAVDTKIETSSGSDVLDEAAASCVKEFGHFIPKRVGPRAEAGWFRMRYKWSFGE